MHTDMCVLLAILFLFIATNRNRTVAAVHGEEDSLVEVLVDTISRANKEQRTRFTGTQLYSWPSGKAFSAFRGIAYAEPPLGELRFRDPKPVHSWPTEVDARWDGHDCPSIYAQNASENCLTLNVYSAELNSSARLPVLVFIHPGGLYIGSGLSSFVGPDYLLEHRIVVVTFNYRLGSLGYLNLGTPNVPGNAGFKDQVLALLWVQKHIRHFGGDPTRVSLMGYSAGALSVGMHLVSPMSQGLFAKAIIMSGTLPPQTPFIIGDQRTMAFRQAHVLNCNATAMTDDAALLHCLNQHSGTEIAATLRSLFDFGKDNPLYLWLPVVEHDFGQRRFLTEDFYGALRAGRFQHVPLLIGYTNGELCTSAADILRNSSLSAHLHNAFDELAPDIFMYDLRGEKSKSDRRHIAGQLKSRYSSGLFTLDRLCDLFSDGLVRFGSEMVARLAAAHGVQVTRYLFTHRNADRSHLAYKAAEVKEERVEHMDDLMYLFRMAAPAGAAATFGSSDDVRMVALYTQFIYDFVAAADSGGDGGKALRCSGSLTTINGCTAPPIKGHVRIGETVSCRSDSSFPEFDFWQALFPSSGL